MNGFCRTPFWNSTLSWNTQIPDFTSCFRNTVMIWLPCSLTWLIGLFEVVTSSKRSCLNPNPWTWTCIFTLGLTLVVCAAELVLSALSYMRHEADLAEISGITAIILTLALVTSLTIRGRQKVQEPSDAVTTFWLLFSVSRGAACYSDIANVHGEPDAATDSGAPNVRALCDVALFALGIIQLVLSSLPAKPWPYLRLQAETFQCVLREWPLLPRTFFAYTWRVVVLGFRNKLELPSLNALCTGLKAFTVSTAFHLATTKKDRLRAFVNENGDFITENPPRRDTKRKLYEVVLEMCRWETFVSALMELTSIASSFVPPVMLGYLLTYIGDKKEHGWHGFAYAAAYGLSQFVGGVMNAHSAYFMSIGAAKVQSALTCALYKKVLRTSGGSLRQYTAGQIMNMMSIDVTQVGQFLTSVNSCWSVPLKIVAALAFLWHYLGPSCLALVVIMLSSILASICIWHYCDKFQKLLMTCKDSRLRQITEILNGIKVIKLNAWEQPFMQKVKETRANEISHLRTFSLLQSAFFFLWTFTPNVALWAMFVTFLLISPAHQLTPSLTFPCLSFFLLLRFPMYSLPDIVSRFIRFAVSLKRLSEFLDAEELDDDAVGTNPEKGNAITVKRATFGLSEYDTPVLEDVDLNFKAGSLVAIVGAVGSGKSALLSAILGTIKKTSGSVDVKGRLAYVAQQPWIQIATLKKNIVFTNPSDDHRYRQIVEACALTPDLDMLPEGDATYVGDRGTNLSGGQKLRISLARAAYHDADVYLLDDPFSSVDAHVASHLFEHVVGPAGILKSKTRLFVTHSTAYLPAVDWIVFLDKGRVGEQGTYDELLARTETKFSKFLRNHSTRNYSEDDSESVAEDTAKRPPDELVEKDAEDECKLADDERANTGNVGWQTYYEYLKRVGWTFFLPALLAAILGSGFEYGSSLWLTAWSQNPDPSRRLGYMLGYGGLLTTTSGFNYIAWLFFVLGSLRAAFSFHSSLLESVVHSSISLFDTTPVGRLVNRFSRDIDLIDRDVPFYAVMTMNCLVAMLILAVVVCLPSAYFGLMMLLVTVLFLGLMWFMLPSFRQMRRLQSVSRSPVLSHFGETVSGVDTIRAFGATKPFMDTLERRLDDYINCNVHFAALEGFRAVAVQVLTLLLSIGSTLVAVLGRDTLDVGMVGMTLTYTLQMSGGMSILLTMAVMLEVSLVAVERVMEYFNQPQEAPWNSGELQPPIGWPSRGDITFTNYSAAYRHNMEPVIRGVSLKISDCQKIGILGRTGTGKSSLALALFRLIEPKSGSITVDGIDIAQIGLHDLRSKMSIIPQDPVVFAGTLRWNLDPFGEHTDAALWEALERAHLKRFLGGQGLNLDCNMTESGDNLSAGQKQLVCLARALLRRSKVLVLDEATSSVDLETSHLVEETIRTEFRGTTVITIAHTVHTVMDCDRILVMNAGKVAEQGPPRELLRRKDGLFSRMALES